ncbi:endolytic transglycosylase MltG [candidate division WOR-3 bacterium]|uniref:Endolytic murein transglycosylase n=1 Tax=candidate division WOR-3 bacterium TaxID=2052148 RepID=A0A937XB87_UNCW3|nr:endolytic transglycosylase MltG [candidate division WOR-3 bacterium]
MKPPGYRCTKVLVLTSLCLCAFMVGHLSCSSRVPSNGRKVEVVVRPGQSATSIADTLVVKQVIGSKPLFLLYAWYYNYNARLRAGRYQLSIGTGERRALRLLAGEEAAVTMVTIPEGYTMNEIAAVLAERGVCPADSFLSACMDTSLLRQSGVRAATAEGYLFPETYEFLSGSAPADVARRLIRQFFSVFAELHDSSRLPPASFLTPSQVVILASIVEREARVPEEFPRIAGVFANRLRRRLPLQSCATVEYLLPQRKGRLSVEDTKIASPYNTYLHAGLPPGPICNPGRRALAAALHPERNDYLFFVARGDGTHLFSRTAAEHAAACRRVRDGG